MYIIKLDAIDSTNTYLRESASHALPMDLTVVWSEVQTHGRGQMGTQWHSEDGKNLTFSIFKRNSGFAMRDRFMISILVSIAICRALKKFHIPKLAIKWPNDILSEGSKICGILIENTIKNNTITGTIIGIGLNVNQRFFNDLPRASSMYLLTGKLYDREEVLTEIVNAVQYYFDQFMVEGKPLKLTKAYEKLLFRLNKPSTFSSGQDTFTGIIKGTTPSGKLKVLLEDNELKSFDFKEITLLY